VRPIASSALARDVCPEPDRRESDVLVSTGEQVTTALLAMALTHAGCPAVSLQGHQIRIVTDQAYSKARIRSIDDARIRSELAPAAWSSVAGFQGVDEDDNITTLGRGGSDTSGVALAAALKADSCEIYTDVDGVYTSDPRICPQAKKLDRISYDEMLELASLGARCCRSVPSSSRSATRCRCTSDRASPTRRHLGRRRGGEHGRRPGVRSHVRQQRGEDHAGSACPTSPGSRPASSAPSPTPTSSST
jgi:aspartate kinase